MCRARDIQNPWRRWMHLATVAVKWCKSGDVVIAVWELLLLGLLGCMKRRVPDVAKLFSHFGCCWPNRQEPGPLPRHACLPRELLVDAAALAQARKAQTQGQWRPELLEIQQPEVAVLAYRACNV
jgi:hypothetical protein